MRNLLLILLTTLLLSSCGKQPEQVVAEPLPSFKQRSLAQITATEFLPFSASSFKAPKIEVIPFNYASNVDAIWGATGRDDEGNIYFGASTHGGDYRTAYLYQYNPVTDVVTPQSDVVEQLKRNGVYEPGAQQNKLHSKFYEADDGYLYFSSFDEGGEAEGVNPYWGGHFWRKKPNRENWEYLFATDEALVAVNSNGRYVYALGYWGHVLYQYDIVTKRFKRVEVGSVGMHMSRNFLVTPEGHAFVPQLKRNDFNETSVVLAEYDTELNQVASHSMPSYQSERLKDHHGIVGYTSVANGNVFFTTADGGLYKIDVNIADPQKKVSYLGPFDESNHYPPSLYAIPGTDIIGGLVNRRKEGHYWVIYQTDLDIKEAIPVELPKGLRRTYFWGTLTKDKLGNYYAAGWSDSDRMRKGMEPILVKLVPQE